MTLTPARRTLNRDRMLDFLDRLTSITGSENVSLYFPPRPPGADIESSLKKVTATRAINEYLYKTIGNSATGAVIFRDTGYICLIIPPFPVHERYETGSLDTERLSCLIGQDYLTALVLVRLGSYAIGVYRGNKRLTGKVGTGLVHGRHHQGGSSAHRFERHRDKQIESFLTRVCRHAREHLEPCTKALDYLVFGGARTTIQLLRKQCPFISRLDTPVLPPLLDIPDPRQPVLEESIIKIYSSMVYEWREND